MLNLAWELAARRDFNTIIDYISDDNPDAAEELRLEVLAKVEALRQQPKIWKPGRVPGTREMIVRGNYIVFYREDDFTVLILRVLHAARNWPEEEDSIEE